MIPSNTHTQNLLLTKRTLLPQIYLRDDPRERGRGSCELGYGATKTRLPDLARRGRVRGAEGGVRRVARLGEGDHLRPPVVRDLEECLSIFD